MELNPLTLLLGGGSMNRAAVILSVAITILAAAACATDSANNRVRYYYSAVLKTHPVKPRGEISAAEAQKRESAGESYYVAKFDNHGRLISLEKRLRGDSFFEFTYSYVNGEAIRTDILSPSSE
jgi:hypothetical protein